MRSLLLALLLAPAARAADLTVGGAGADHATIQAAVDAAQPGDRVLVRDGVYAGFTIDGKPLTVMHDEGALPIVDGTAAVRNLAAGEQVWLVGLQVDPQQVRPALALDANAGEVWAVSSLFRAYRQFGAEGAVEVEASARLALVRCWVEGRHGIQPIHLGSVGVWARDSGLELHECEVFGGDGIDPSDDDGNVGGVAVELEGACTFFASDSFLRGGLGGTAECDLVFGTCCDVPCPYGDSWALSVFQPELSTGAWEGTFFQEGATADGTPLAAIQPEGWGAEVQRAPTCFGTPEGCPCANPGRAGAGCEHSFALGGGLLEATGDALVSADTLALHHGTVGPTASAFFFQGTETIASQAGTPFGDGLRCAGGVVRRLGSKLSAAGLASFGHGVAGDPAISVQGQVPPAGGTRWYQVWYRNVQAFCTPAAFNLSSALEVRWLP